MIEGHVIVDAYFTNDKRTHLQTMWREESTGIVRPHNINVEEDPDQYNKFLSEYNVSVDDLHERTFLRIKEMRESYEQQIIKIAKREKLIEDTENQDAFDVFTNYLFSKNADNESLFKLKLLIFEQEHVKNSENRALKGKLRKAKTITEIIARYNEF
tara:strand:- start:3867 stop:4337 length:471 start_codon:yes stop_codon:yes gene_type:complete